ncbi:hypothetical protein [Paenisporosarcina sp. NPDC076907]|uniref:hypothetical protein n=1 Tax=Paenisporosarcina sp. NPDC076907 TaxID=3390604 RepID=UPI003D03E4E4
MFISKSNLLLLCSLLLFILSSCGVADDGIITAKDVIKQDSEADIIQINGFIYSNMTELEWFQERKEKLIKHTLLGETQKQSTSSFGFKDWTATKLPVGTKIYSASENGLELDILIVEVDDKVFYYMKFLEG